MMPAAGTQKKECDTVEIRRVSIEKLNPAAYNPRKNLQPSDPEYRKLARSMERYGCVEPIVWNERTGNVVGGHQRLKILIASGAQEVDVSVVDLPLEDEKALNIALNKISGEWDSEKLSEVLQELSQGFDVTLTGFDLTEVDRMLSSFSREKHGYDLPGMNSHISNFFEDRVPDKPEKTSAPVATPQAPQSESQPERRNIVILNLLQEDAEALSKYLDGMGYTYRMEDVA